MCGRLVNLDTVARVIADYYHLKTDTQLAALNDALSRVPAETVGKELFGISEQLDTISRAAAINAICEDGTQLERQGRYSMTMVERKQRDADILDALPSAQPDIVACGDCIHWICHDRRCGYWNHGVKPLDWCCHAERRTDG